MVVNDANSFGSTICSICYEDLKPISEDLQAISLCGHVFHELCLQQWFEYSSKSKKCTCPVCKQSCSGSNVSRLYFQSVGDVNESMLSLQSIKNKANDSAEDPKLLRCEIKRLEAKVSNLNSVVDGQGKEIKQLNEELCLCKDQLKHEVKLRNDATEQKAIVNRLLSAKSQELDILKLESIRLQERNMALAKELAALKLVSDLDVNEDEIVKLASFGNESNNKETIDILKRSLIIRNKSYKDLMAKCNELGKGEARSSKQLEKAKEKISKLKTRVQQLETASEVKENEALRTLKTAKKLNGSGAIINGVNDNEYALSGNSLSECEKGQQSAVHLVQPVKLANDLEHFDFINARVADSNNESRSNMALKRTDVYSRTDNVASELSTAMHLHDLNTKYQCQNDSTYNFSKTEAVSVAKTEATGNGDNSQRVLSNLKSFICVDKGNNGASGGDAEVIVLDDSPQEETVLNFNKDYSSSFKIFKPGNTCFSGGLLGPDGTNRYLGKWCKRGDNKTTRGSGDLIAVGSDGRGGRVKVLRSLNQSILDSKENSVSAKRCKNGDKAGSSQHKGYLQIEHFFGRAGR